MTGRKLIRRTVLALLFACGILIFFAAIDAQATPISPDIRKLLDQQNTEKIPRFAPARAGWHGPEFNPIEAAASTPMERYSAAASARAVREALVAAAIPDWRILLVILGLILLLRKLGSRTTKEPQQASEYKEAAAEIRPAA